MRPCVVNPRSSVFTWPVSTAGGGQLLVTARLAAVSVHQLSGGGAVLDTTGHWRLPSQLHAALGRAGSVLRHWRPAHQVSGRGGVVRGMTAGAAVRRQCSLGHIDLSDHVCVAVCLSAGAAVRRRCSLCKSIDSSDHVCVDVCLSAGASVRGRCSLSH